jgi:hypothetical protein
MRFVAGYIFESENSQSFNSVLKPSKLTTHQKIKDENRGATTRTVMYELPLKTGMAFNHDCGNRRTPTAFK